MKLIIRLFIVILMFAFIAPAYAANTQDGNSVTITTPNGGEQYDSGDTIKFKWNSTVSDFIYTYTYVNIYKLRGALWDPMASDYNVYVDTNNPIHASPEFNGIPDTGSYNWKVPNSLSDGKYVAAVYVSYWNDINAHDGGIQSDWSNLPFTIGDGGEMALIPTLSKLSPTSTGIGTTVTVTGTGFLATNDVNLRSTSNGVTLAEVTNISSTSLKFKVPSNISPGQYAVSVINSNGESHTATLTVTESSSIAHSVGTNIKGADGTVYRIAEGNYRSPYTSAGAFLSYKFNNWSGVIDASSADLALPISSTFIPPRNGSLINDKGTVYLITGGLRAGFANEAAFKGMGYNYVNVYPGDTSFMTSMAPINSSAQKHPNGALINDNGTLYVMQNGYRVGFPSMAVLDSWGYWVSEAVPANSYDRQAEVSGVMQTRMPNQMSI